MPWAEDKLRLETMTEEERAEYYRNRAARQRDSYYNAPNRRAAMDRKNELARKRRAAALEKREQRDNPPSKLTGAAALDEWLKEGKQEKGFTAFLHSPECVRAAQLNVSSEVA